MRFENRFLIVCASSLLAVGGGVAVFAGGSVLVHPGPVLADVADDLGQVADRGWRTPAGNTDPAVLYMGAQSAGTQSATPPRGLTENELAAAAGPADRFKADAPAASASGHLPGAKPGAPHRSNSDSETTPTGYPRQNAQYEPRAVVRAIKELPAAGVRVTGAINMGFTFTPSRYNNGTMVVINETNQPVAVSFHGLGSAGIRLNGQPVVEGQRYVLSGDLEIAGSTSVGVHLRQPGADERQSAPHGVG